MTTFDTTLHTKDAEDIIPVSVSYEMRDLGVMGRHNENVRPVIRVVLFRGNRLDELSDDQIEWLEQQAARHEAGLRDLQESYRLSH